MKYLTFIFVIYNIVIILLGYKIFIPNKDNFEIHVYDEQTHRYVKFSDLVKAGRLKEEVAKCFLHSYNSPNHFLEIEKSLIKNCENTYK